MTSTMNFKGLMRRNSHDGYIQEGSLKKKSCGPWQRRSLNSFNNKYPQHGENTPGTLPRGRNQLNRTSSNSLVDYSDPLRTTVVLEKQDNEAFGFEMQTYGVQPTNSTAVELCTFVCKVQEDSAAESAGLTAGDIIVTINGLSIEGSSHQHIVDLIRNSTNLLKMETVSGSVVKRIELEKKKVLLKQTLHEKWAELQALTLKEKCLTRGNLNDPPHHPSLDSLTSLASPTGRAGQRSFSDSSFLSAMTESSEDGAFVSSVFDDSPLSPSEHGAFFPRELQAERTRPPLSRSRSGSLSPSSPWESPGASSLFGTLPRRARRGSVRQHILKFIPGLNRSLELEEEENT